ncbi:MAG: tRNA uridine-5-carboxymethylaminomethyl(34) synthesis GTPase MnmE [Acidobacteria bacterium]|nr:tRNA uridine-5-carboxymethylaminomethyl(34) synthesis GTPase MnmE [Acidobacteriota bacterium]MBI3422638.1 tRNA uridine-5-carboxymethylaminomethyl(34) synthesis GTPase MnmE [Acidobacteriota bacterium]
MRPVDFKTIAAIATPAGYGGIGIIRISGHDSLHFTRQLLHQSASKQLTPNQVTLQQLFNPNTSQLMDEALVTYFQAPHSFTGEDVVELSCHGSPVVLAELLRLLVSFGAELAQPGEFSLRAFLNHRLDLTQAEAIHDLIHAQTSFQAQLAARQLRGELSKQMQPIKQALIELIVWFESSVEFVEDDLDALDLQHFRERLSGIAGQISRLAESYRAGRLIHSGAKLALIGRPNVGKSSLFNALLGIDRAIVTPLPGTTRDTLAETLSINGIPVRLIDTAGLRETDDVIEKLGVERTLTAVAEADLVLAIASVESTLSDEELDLFKKMPVGLCVLNKCDLTSARHVEVQTALSQYAPVLSVSALMGQGIVALRQAIYQRLVSAAQINTEDAIITNERHYAALEQALTSLRAAEQDLTRGFTEEIALTNLHQALRQLGVITGETLIGDIINQIFSTFCIGK